MKNGVVATDSCIDYFQAYTKHSKCNGHSHSYSNIIVKIQYFPIISVYELVPMACKDRQEKNSSILDCPIVWKHIDFFAEYFMLLLTPSKE